MNEEQRFLEEYDPAEFERPSVAVDVVLLTEFRGEIRVLLVRRSEHPHRGSWTLPGGFLPLDRTLEETAAAVLSTKAGLTNVFLEQLFTFGSPGRDPTATARRGGRRSRPPRCSRDRRTARRRRERRRRRSP